MLNTTNEPGLNTSSPASNPVRTQETTGRAFFRLASQPVCPLDLKTHLHFLDRLSMLEAALQQGQTYFREVSATSVKIYCCSRMDCWTTIFLCSSLFTRYGKIYPFPMNASYRGWQRVRILECLGYMCWRPRF